MGTSHSRGFINSSCVESPSTPEAGIDSRRSAGPILAATIIRPGDIRDYDALARFHYLAGRPAVFVRILRAEIEPGVFSARRRGPCMDTGRHAEQTHRGRVLLGVLVVSMPVLNSRLRPQAWPGRYRTADRRADMLRVNRELRAISRVVIDPRVRGIGLASLLVREYLMRPLTPATEAVAAMGGCCPFFRSAGMTPYQLPPTHHELRLADALASLGLSPTEVLADPDRRSSLLLSPFIQRELVHFSRGNPRSVRKWRSQNDILIGACAALCSPRVGYAHCKEDNR